jgi:hypothetical protein
MLLYALLSERSFLWLAAVAVGCTVLMFVSWEWFILRQYGDSHFLFALGMQSTPLTEKLKNYAVPLVTLLGGVAPAVALLGLAGLRRGCLTIALAAYVFLLAYEVVACTTALLPVPQPICEAFQIPLSDQPVVVTLEHILFTQAGALTCLILAAVCWHLAQLPRGGWRPAHWWAHRETSFLLLWLGLEVAGFFALTPFVAVRRIMGVMVVATLLTGHLASRTCRSPRRVALVRGIAVLSAVLGLGFYVVDFFDAWAEMQAVEVAAARIRYEERQSTTALRADYLAVTAASPAAGFPANVPWAALGLSGRTPTVWYVGHWGFQHYAERAGMVPVVPGRSELLAGDWLVKPDWRITQQVMYPPDPDEADPLPDLPGLVASDGLPLRTIMCFYADSRGVPLEHHEGPRVPVTIYHIKANFVARKPPPVS